jgi:glycosyltransferase involved in cell wall biosynthesis
MNDSKITVSISTKDRYDILHMCLMSIFNQTYKPKEVLIYDDGECKDLRDNYIYKKIFQCFDNNDIAWRVLEGAKKGQIHNHQSSLEDATTEWIYRVDDDNILAPDVLEKLLPYTEDPELGAVGPVVIHPESILTEDCTSPKLQDCFFKYACQLAPFSGVKDVEHLYSTFLIRKKAAAHGYPLYLSKIAHHEETIFSYEMFRRGWKLKVIGDAYAYHFRAPSGGIRCESDKTLWDNDALLLREKMKEWNVKVEDFALMVNFHAIGDHFIMKSIIEEFRAKNAGKRIVIGAIYPGIFFDVADIDIISVNSALTLSGKKSEDFDIYKWCYENNWKGHLKDAFRTVYGLI